MGKTIGNNDSPNLNESLKKYIKAENKREADSLKTYYRQFDEDEWSIYEDEFYGRYPSTKPWWADYGVESSLEEDELNYHDDDDDEELDIEYYKAHSNDLKQIYYYDDISDKWGRITFNNIKEFNDFCAETGIFMTDETANNILYNFETHCCLDPIEKEKGNLILVDDTSYGGLTWTVGVDEEEFEEIYTKSKKTHKK